MQHDSSSVDTGRQKRRRLEIPDVGPKASPGSVGNPLEIESDGDSSQEGGRADRPGASWWHDVSDLKDLSPGDQASARTRPSPRATARLRPLAPDIRLENPHEASNGQVWH